MEQHILVSRQHPSMDRSLRTNEKMWKHQLYKKMITGNLVVCHDLQQLHQEIKQMNTNIVVILLSSYFWQLIWPSGGRLSHVSVGRCHPCSMANRNNESASQQKNTEQTHEELSIIHFSRVLFTYDVILATAYIYFMYIRKIFDVCQRSMLCMSER